MAEGPAGVGAEEEPEGKPTVGSWVGAGVEQYLGPASLCLVVSSWDAGVGRGAAAGAGFSI